jgi:radical SAM superfamily enzyme YgiQ (UPF0313 family)
MKKILILNLPGPVVKAGSRWYNKTKTDTASLKYYPYPWFMGYLTALLKKNKFKAKLVDSVALEWTQENTLSEVKKFKPNIIVCEPTWVSAKEDREILDKIDPKITKIAVGNYATNFPEKCLKEIGIDYVAIGEYEFSILKFLQTNKPQVNFLSKRKRNYQYPELVNLDEFPFPERNDTPMSYYNEPSCFGRNIVIVASRGCRFKCSFCNVECIYGKHIYRIRDPKSVVDEIEYLLKNYCFDELYFDDDNMVARKDYVEDICREIIQRNIKVSWVCMGDGRVTDETLELLSKAGCKCYKFGLEHLDRVVLASIPKPLSKESSLHVIEKTKSLGMRSYVNLIVGLPGSSRKKDIKMLKEVFSAKPDLIQIAIATPYPGTKFNKDALENGWLKSTDPSYFDATGHSPISYPNYSSDEIEYVFRLGWQMWYRQVLTRQPSTLLFFVASEVKRNGIISTLKKSVSYLIKLINPIKK